MDILNLLSAENRAGLGLSIVPIDHPIPAISAAKEERRKEGGTLVFVGVWVP